MRELSVIILIFAILIAVPLMALPSEGYDSSQEGLMKFLAESSNFSAPSNLSAQETQEEAWRSIISSPPGNISSSVQGDPMARIGSNLNYYAYIERTGEVPRGHRRDLTANLTDLRNWYKGSAMDLYESQARRQGQFYGYSQHIIDRPSPPTASEPGAIYQYEREKSYLAISMDALNAALRLKDSDGSQDSNTDIDPYISTLPNLNYIKQSRGDDGLEGSEINANSNLNLLAYGTQAHLDKTVEGTSLVTYSYGWGGAEITNHRQGTRNYAVVVGINRYSDRRSLHTSVNDANAIASILEGYGYQVIKLTDDTEVKPTKHNILEGALAEIETKKNKGKVILYFSGHAEVDDRSNFYLIPQDADGSPSSYIGGKELDGYIKGIQGLAIIIDACHSGGLNYMARDGQIVLTSSKEDEPSNEDWTGSFSIFTHQLCSALKEEGRLGTEVMLQRCFYRARDNTIRWSNSRLLSQTPKMVDMTGGRYYIN